MENQLGQQVETATKPSSDKLQEDIQISISSVNWSNTPIYELYKSEKSNVIEPSSSNFSESEVDQVLEKFRTDANSYRKKEEAEPYYVKALSTLQILMNEQSVDAARIQKIQDMYKDVSLETTMKLLIRCRMAYDTRRTVLELFDTIDTYQSQYEELRDIILKAAGDNDALTVQEIICDNDKMNEIKNVSKVIKSSAQSVLKKSDELRKREEKGEKGSYTVLFKNEDLIERVLGEVKHIKFLLDKCKKKDINNDLGDIQTNPDSIDGQERTTKVQFEEDENSAEVRRGSTKSQRKGSNQKRKKRSTGTPSGRGSNMSNKSNRSNKSPRQMPGQPYQNVPYPNDHQNQFMTIPETENYDMYQQRMMKQHHQMFKTAHEGGFYQAPHTDRSMSKKRKKAKGKKARNNSQYNFAKTQQQHAAQTPITGSTSYTPNSVSKPPSMYGIKNVTMMKNPLQFANTGQNFFNHEKLTDTSMNMSNAMKRKIHLPNAMPRRQELIYDLNGRPIYRASAGGTADNKSKSPRLQNDQDAVSYSGYSPFVEENNKLPIQILQNKKGSPLNIRTEHASRAIFKTRKSSHMVPKHSNYNVQKDPVKILHTQLSTVTKQNVMREASSSPPQKLPDIKPPSRGIDQIQKLKRPEAASEKAHIFNPRARSVNRQQANTKPGENSGIGLMSGASETRGAHIQINKMGINKNSQPDMDVNQGLNTQRDEFKANNMKRKLSPIDKLNTDRGMNSTHTHFGFKKNSIAETSFGNIRNRGTNDEASSNMDLSFVSQNQNKWPQYGRQSQDGHHKKEAIGSLYSANPKVDHFTSQYSSVWLKGKEGMFNDHSIGSDVQRQKREANSMLFHMERQQKKMEKMQERAAKDALCQHYLEHYGILPTSQQRFFLDPVRLRELLIKMATQVTQRAAATRIQNWVRGRLRRQNFLKMLRDTIWATKKLQRFFRRYRLTVILPRKLRQRQQDISFFIQQCLRGYQARRKMLKEKANMQIEREYDYWHRINLIQKGNFQRRVRRMWLAYKERKAEKERKKKEAEAAKKAKLGKGRRRAPMPAAAPTLTTTTKPAAAAKPADAAKPTDTLKKPEVAQDLSATMKLPLTKQISTAQPNLSQTIPSGMQKTDSEIFDNEQATQKDGEEVQMMDGEVVNITVSQGNEGTKEEDKTGEPLDIIDEEQMQKDNVDGENNEGQENQDGGEQAENEEGMDGGEPGEGEDMERADGD